MSFPLWPTLFWLGLALMLGYFLMAGARTFVHGPGDEGPAFVASLAFGTGMFAVMALGFRAPLPQPRALASAALMTVSLALYEWARHTIRERRFRIAWSGEVPPELCTEGPYRLVRHPVYASYIVAFAAIAAALPGLPTIAFLAFAAALFTHAARSDERALLASELGPAYRAYRARTGMFVPRLRSLPFAGG